VCLYLVFESLLVKWCGAHREGNLFCLRSEDADGFIFELLTAIEQNNLRYVCNDNYRYLSINMASLPRFGTLEFRALPAENTFERIPIWVKMLLRIKDESLKFETVRQIVETFSGQGAKEFIKSVMGDMYNPISCNDEYEKLLEGVRRIQDVAYQVPIQNVRV
jgi:hypothetical protein